MIKVLSVVMFLIAGSVQAEEYICKSNFYGKKPVPGQSIYTIHIKETRECKRCGKWDSAYDVDVKITRQPVFAGSPAILIAEGQSTAYSEDVIYRIVDRNLRISFVNYLDEWDQAHLTIYQADRTIEVPMTCDLAHERD